MNVMAGEDQHRFIHEPFEVRKADVRRSLYRN